MANRSRKAMVPMSIRLRTLVIVVASTLLFLGGMSALSGMLVLDSYRALEADVLSGNSARTVNMLSREAEALLRVNRDWAYWDDTYAYMDDMSELYEAVNLKEETMETLHLAAMVFLSPDGTVNLSSPPTALPSWSRYGTRGARWSKRRRRTASPDFFSTREIFSWCPGRLSSGATAPDPRKGFSFSRGKSGSVRRPLFRNPFSFP